MIRRIAICCNGLVPGSRGPSSAHGLRAHGLFLGLSAAGFTVQIVSPSNAITTQLERWNLGRIRIPPHWRIVTEAQFSAVLNEDYDAVLFPNWPVAKGFDKRGDTRIIYDFFSATMVEHAAIFEEAEVQRKKEEKIRLLEQADYVIANGGVQAEYGQSFIAAETTRKVTGSLPSVRLAIPWCEPSPPDDGLRIFFGGFHQAWTKGVDLDDLNRIARETGAEIHTIGLGQHLHFRDMSRAGSLAAVADRVVNHDVASFQRYQALNAGCHLALDIFEPNEERRISYSTRAVSSLACGCPLVTMGFTEIGRRIEETGAGWTLSDFCADALDTLLHRLADNSAEIADARRRTKEFHELYIDPSRQVAPLVAMLKAEATNVG